MNFFLGFKLPGCVGKILIGETLSPENLIAHPTWKPVSQETLITGSVGRENRPVAAPLQLSFSPHTPASSPGSKSTLLGEGEKNSASLPSLDWHWGGERNRPIFACDI